MSVTPLSSAAFRSNSMNGSTITLNTVDKIKDVKEEITFAEYKGYLREKTHMFQVIGTLTNL